MEYVHNKTQRATSVWQSPLIRHGLRQTSTPDARRRGPYTGLASYDAGDMTGAARFDAAMKTGTS